MKQFLVVGLGRFGTSLAKTLYKHGEQVLGLDMDEDILQEAINNDIIDNGIAVDATDIEELKNLGVNNFDVAFVCIGTGIQNSILVTLTLKELGIPRIIAKALTKQHGRVLDKIGANEIIYPEMYMGERTAIKEINPNMVEHMQLSDEYKVIEKKAPDIFMNKSLIELDLRKKYDLNIIAIKNENGDMTITPMGDKVIKKGDTLIAISNTEGARKLENLE
ncbi:MAG: potassium channel family protein [Fusobacteriota bacterium]